MPNILQRFVENWIQRHRLPFNYILHAIGIPLTVVAIVPLVRGKFGMAALLFILGYLLQFLGHAHEGSEVGEFLWVKKIFKK